MNINYVWGANSQQIKTTFIPSSEFYKFYSNNPKFWEEILDDRTYSLFRTLELSEDFEKAVGRIRKVCKIPPEGYSWKEWLDFDDKKYEVIISKILRVSFVLIIDEFNIPTFLNAQTADIIAANHVYLPLRRMELEVGGRTETFYEGPAVKICVYTKVKSKTEFKDFVNLYWDQIKEATSELDELKKITINDRHLSVLELHEKERKTYKEIEAEYSKRDRDNAEDKIEFAENLKQRKFNAKQRIRSLLKKKDHSLK